MNIHRPRSPRGRVPHARLFRKHLRALRNDVHLAHLLKQNLELKALVKALAEKFLEGKSRTEVRRVLHEVLVEQRRIYNEALSRHAIKEARTVDELLLMLDEIRAADRAELADDAADPDSGSCGDGRRGKNGRQDFGDDSNRQGDRGDSHSA